MKSEQRDPIQQCIEWLSFMVVNQEDRRIVQAELESIRDAHQQDMSRLTRQAQDISHMLSEVGCGAMPVVDGVRWLVTRDQRFRQMASVVEHARCAAPEWCGPPEPERCAICQLKEVLVTPGQTPRSTR